MKNSRLIQVLKTFSPEEMKEFSEFVASPFFNKNKNVIKLFEIIRKHYPDLETDKLDKEKVFVKVYANEKYKDSTMRLLIFYLFEVVEKFITYNRSMNEPLMHSNLFLAGEYLDRSLYKEFEKTLKETDKDIENTPYKSESYYLNRFTTDHLFMNYLSAMNYDKYDRVMTKGNIEKVFNNLTYHYLLRVMKFYTVLLNAKMMFKTDADIGYFENIVNKYDSKLFKEAPLLDIYYNVIMCLVKPDEEDYYFKLKKLIVENHETIDRDSLEDIMINLENYCTRKLRAGNNKYIKENFDVFNLELSLPGKIYLGKGFLSGLFYKNAINIACATKNFEWAENFLEEHKNELQADERKQYYNFCSAQIAYHKKNLEQSLTFLSKVKVDELYLKQEVKILQCQIYYDLSLFIPLTSLVDTFKRTIMNNKVMPEVRKKNFLLFGKFIERLSNVKSNPEKYSARKLEDELSDADFFAHKNWIENKLKELV